MRKSILTISFLLGLYQLTTAQNVGIGTTSPANKLDIQDDNSLISSIRSNLSTAHFKASSVSGVEAGINFSTWSTGSTFNRWVIAKGDGSETGLNTGSDLIINRYDDAGNYIARAMEISRATGNVDMFGKLSIPELRISSGAFNGYILQSDGSGNATWVSPSSFVVAGTGLTYSGNTLNSVWTTSGNNIFKNNPGNVGIGVGAPTQLLHVGNSGSDNYLQVDAGGVSSNYGGIMLKEPGFDFGWALRFNAGTDDLTLDMQDDSFTNAVTFKRSGNVGIGLSSPEALLHLKHTLPNTSTDASALILDNPVGGTQTSLSFRIDNAHRGRIRSDINGNMIYSAFDDGDQEFRQSDLNTRMIIKGNTGYVGIGTSTPSEKLEVSGKTKTTTFAMTNGATNGYVLQTDASGNASWVSSAGLNTNQWSISGNSGTSPTNFIGTTDNNALVFKVNNIKAGKIESDSVNGNTGFGMLAQNATSTNTLTCSFGINSLKKLTAGVGNTAIGANAMYSQTSQGGNTAVGYNALYNSTIGFNNTAIGQMALENNIDGDRNTAVGVYALQFSTTASNKTSVGHQALVNTTTGSNNVSIGLFAGGNNVTGSNNVFLGYNAGAFETGSDKLYIANTNTSAPLIYGNFSTKKVTINDSLAAKYFTITNGAANGYILQSDASGNANWVSPSSSVVVAGTGLSYSGNTLNSLWITSGLDMYNNAVGQTGIGTPTPGAKMEVAAADGNALLLSSSNTSETLLRLNNSSIGSATIQWTGPTSSLGQQKLVFITPGSDALMTLDEQNNFVGIGTTSPTVKLEVSGKTKTNDIQLSNGAANGYVLQSDANGNASWVAPSSLSTSVWTVSGSDIYKNNSGNVGIGTSSPTALLHVNNSSGSATINIQSTSSNAHLNMNAGASGNESSITAFTNGSQRWSFGKSNTAESGSDAGSDFFINRYNDAGTFQGQPFVIKRSTGNIGIGGIGNPVQKLDVSGSVNVSSSNGYYIGNSRILSNSGVDNLFAGVSAGASTTGSSNTFVGKSAGQSNTTGNDNTALGINSLNGNTGGDFNTAIGGGAGVFSSGSNNVLLGYGAGAVVGSNNIIIGFGAGGAETGSNKLYIDNSNTSSPLIHGDFSTNELTINGTMDIMGAMGLKIQTGQTAGTNNPTAAAGIWIYSSGTGTIDLISAAAINRMLIIINNTGATRFISTYRDLSNAAQNTITNNTSLWIVHDGTNWRQIK